MKLTRKQQQDLDSCLYFLPANCKSMLKDVNDVDIASYFAWSDTGDQSFVSRKTKGAEAIRWGKTYRDLFVSDMLRDLHTTVFVWELAYENPDLPISVQKSIGIEKQFTNWRDIFDSDDWDETARQQSEVNFPNKAARDLSMSLYHRATAGYVGKSKNSN